MGTNGLSLFYSSKDQLPKPNKKPSKKLSPEEKMRAMLGSLENPDYEKLKEVMSNIILGKLVTAEDIQAISPNFRMLEVMFKSNEHVLKEFKFFLEFDPNKNIIIWVHSKRYGLINIIAKGKFGYDVFFSPPIGK